MGEITEASGLTSARAEELLSEVGLNCLPAPVKNCLLEIFFRQFLSPFIYILVIAAIVSLLVSQIPSAVFIVIVLFLNAIIGTVQEYSAQKSASALRQMVKGVAHVIRDGVAQTIDVEQVVPGDRVLLNSGDKVPADMLLLTARNLAVDESM